MTRIRRATIATLLLFLAIVPVPAEELPPGANVAPVVYAAAAVEITSPLTARQGQPVDIAGRAYWPLSGAPVTVGLVTIILHFPPAPGTDDHARATDAVAFALIQPTGGFAAVIDVPYLLAPDETEVSAMGQFNLFTILDVPDVPSLMVIGHADVWLPVTVTQ